MYFPAASPIYAAPAAPSYYGPEVYAQPAFLPHPQPLALDYGVPGYGAPAFATAPVYEAIYQMPAMVPYGGPMYEDSGYWARGNDASESHHAGREDPVGVENMSTQPPSGRKKAVVIGINYTGTPAALRGCVADAHNIRNHLISKGFPNSSIRMLTDEGQGTEPTKKNMLDAMRWLSQGAQPGDVLWFSFSGHGAQKKAKDQAEADGMDETICPSDYKKGHIIDNEIFDIVCKPLPAGVRLTCIMDCCHSGTGMDLPCTYSQSRSQWLKDRYPNICAADVRMLSGCEDAQTSADLGTKGGALTLAYLEAAKGNSSTQQVLQQITGSMTKKSMSQRPQLSSSHAFDLSRPWNLNDIALDEEHYGEYNGRSRAAPPGQAAHKPREFTGYDAEIQRELVGKSNPCSIM